jgi:hypothetical protein
MQFTVGNPVPNHYNSSIAIQPSTSPVFKGVANNPVVGLNINTAGSLVPMVSATNFKFNTTGTTNVADITNAKLYYSGTMTTFNSASATMLGTAIANPSGTLTFSSTQTLLVGDNYFWLTYDIPLTATTNHYVDAAVVSFDCSTFTNIVPTTPSPVGNRQIWDDKLMYGYDASGAAPYVNVPVSFMASNPGTLTALTTTVWDALNNGFWSGGTWANNQWYITTYATAPATSTFYYIDQTTWAPVFVGVTGAPFYAISYDYTNNTMYGLAYGIPAAGYSSLYTININTGASAYIGNVGTGVFTSLAINNEGILYALSINDDMIYTVNKTTGEPTLLGPIGADANYAQEMEFDRATGKLWLAGYFTGINGQLRVINPLTGASTPIANIYNGNEITALAIPYSGISTTITTANPTPTPSNYPPGYNGLSVAFTVAGTINSDNFFTLQLSSPSGAFDAPTVLATMAGTTSGVFNNVTIPLITDPSSNYRLRVVASSPDIAGSDNGSNITIGFPTLTTGIISPTTYLPGGVIGSIPFTVVGRFETNNYFRAQLSDGLGSFTSPYEIGTLAGQTSGAFTNVTIPANAPNGTAYRIRIVGNNPLTIGTINPDNITIGTGPSPKSLAITVFLQGCQQLTGAQYPSAS